MRKVRTRTLLIAGAVVALVLAGVISFYASRSPDGLEKVAADKGMDQKAEEHKLADGPLSDYGVKGVDNDRISGGLAGVLGVGATLLVGSGVFWLVKRRGTGKGGEGSEEVPEPDASAAEAASSRTSAAASSSPAEGP